MLQIDKRYIQLYDENKRAILGSDGSWPFDQRWSDRTAMNQCALKVRQQAHGFTRAQALSAGNPKMLSMYVKPRACYASLMWSERVIIPMTPLNNPLFPKTHGQGPA